MFLKKYPYALFVFLAFLIGCSGGGDQEARVYDLSLEVAKLDDTTFTLADLNKQLDGNGWNEHAGLKRIKDTAEFNLKAMDDLILDVLLTERAEIYSIDTVLEAQKRIREHMRMFVLRMMYQEAIVERTEVNPEDVDTSYENNRQLYFNPATANVAHILVTTNPSFYIEEGQSHSDISKDSIDFLAREKMSEILAKVKDGVDFEELAKEYSDDQNSGQKAGSLGWVKKGQTPPAFDSTVWVLEIGEVSPAIKTMHGYHLIKVFERTDSSYTPLDGALYGQIAAQIRAGLTRRLAAEYLDSLQNLAKITYNEKHLKLADSIYEPSDWLAVVNGVDTVYAYEYSGFAGTYQMKNRLATMEVADKKKVLDQFIPAHILDLEAKKQGYYDRDKTIEELAIFTLQQAKHQLRLNGTLPSYSPTDEEIQEYYDANIDQYHSDKPLHVQHILFEDSMRAENIRRKIDDGADFREMAMKHYPGEEEIRESLFDLDYISQDEMPQAFWNAAWLLSEGDVSRPVRTEYGYHLIKLIDRRPTTSFEEAKKQVKKTLVEAKRREVKEAWLLDLLAGHTIEIDSAMVRDFLFQSKARLAELGKTADTTVSER
jgi:parvulin-like peptidyl-prolyl isomerase